MQRLTAYQIIDSLKELNREVVPHPMAVIYSHPLACPEGCVIRIFDRRSGRPTSLCVVRQTVEECRQDITENGFSKFFQRAPGDEPEIVESWVMDGDYREKPVHDHYIFYGNGRRQISEAHGFKVNLCLIHHNAGKESVNQNENYDKLLKRMCQQAYESDHSHEGFMEIFHENFL